MLKAFLERRLLTLQSTLTYKVIAALHPLAQRQVK